MKGKAEDEDENENENEDEDKGYRLIPDTYYLPPSFRIRDAESRREEGSSEHSRPDGPAAFSRR